MITCKNCGGEIADTAKFCLKCGTKVVRHPFCPNCGTELKPDTKFCPACGTARVRQSQMQGVQSASTNQGLFSYGQNFSSNTNTLPKKERSFNLWQKFFTLLVVFGYFMVSDVNINRLEFKILYYVPIGNPYDYYRGTLAMTVSRLSALSIMCAGLTFISAIAYEIGKKPAIKTFSTSMHFLGFFLFAVWMYITLAVFLPNFGLSFHEAIVGVFKVPHIYVILAGWIISSIPIGGKNDNV